MLGRLGVLALLILVLSPHAGFAFRLVPIEMEFEPAGRGATQVFRLENDRDQPAAIEVKMFRRAMDAEGRDQLSDAEGLFVVYPQQLVLMPGKAKSVRVQWAGRAELDREEAFRLIAEQLPVELDKSGAPTGGKVRLLVRYVASVYVRPAGARPDIKVEAAGARGDQLDLVLANRGTSRQLLTHPTLSLTAGGRSVTLTARQLDGLAGENLLAGVERHFLLPWPKQLPRGPVQADLALGQ